MVVQGATVEVEGDTALADQRASSLLKQPFQVGVERTLGADPSFPAVVDQPGDQGDARIAAYGSLLTVVQGSGTNGHSPFRTDQARTAVVEASAVQGGSSIGHQPATLVVQLAPAGNEQATRTGESPRLVIDLVGLHCQRPFADQCTAPLVVQCTTERYIHHALAAEQAAIAIEQFSAVQVQSIATGEHTLGLIQQALHG